MVRKLFGLTVLSFSLLAAAAATALANAPNPTSIQVISETPAPNGGTTVTIAGSWTWDQSVPSGGQQDCNDSRIGVGYAVSWGDNTANKALRGPNNTLIHPGDSQDDWVHSVSEGMSGGNLESGSSTGNGNTLIVDGPFKTGKTAKLPETGGLVTESMTGKTKDAVDNGFTSDSGEQGISDTSTDNALPTKTDAMDWYSNCGPTQAKTAVIDGVTVTGPGGQAVGNSDPSDPSKGYPNGFWGPISHTFAGSGPFTICPIMYDPHGAVVGDDAGDPSQITADANGDNSVEKNGNANACPITITIKGQSAISTQAMSQATTDQSISDTATIVGKDHPSGTVTFNLYGPSDPGDCSSAPVFTSTTNGSFTSISSSTSTFQSGSYSPMTAGTYRWTASYSGDGNNGSASEGCNGGDEETTVTVPGQASLAAVKTEADSAQGEPLSSGPITANPGDTIDYQVQVTNTGNVNLTDLTLSDTVHNQTFGDAPCSNIEGPFTDPDESEALTGPLTPGHVAFFTCIYVVPAGTTGNITNLATATGTPPTGSPVTSPPTTVTATPASISVVKLESDSSVAGEGTPSAGPITVNQGDTISYVVKATNTGDENLLNPTFSDVLTNPGSNATTCSNVAGPFSSPSGGAFTGPLAPGQSVYFTCSYVVSAGSTGPITNTGKVTATPANGGHNVSGQSTVKANKAAVSACTVHAISMSRIGIRKGTEFVVSGTGITKLVFRLNGKVIKTLTQPNDNGKFMVKVLTKRMRMGANRLTATASEACGSQVKAATLQRRPTPHRPRRPSGFTG